MSIPLFFPETVLPCPAICPTLVGEPSTYCTIAHVVIFRAAGERVSGLSTTEGRRHNGGTSNLPLLLGIYTSNEDFRLRAEGEQGRERPGSISNSSTFERLGSALPPGFGIAETESRTMAPATRKTESKADFRSRDMSTEVATPTALAVYHRSRGKAHRRSWKPCSAGEMSLPANKCNLPV